MKADLSLMTTADVMHLLKFQTPEGTIGCLHRHGVKALRVGRRYLWRRDDVVRLISKTSQKHLP